MSSLLGARNLRKGQLRPAKHVLDGGHQNSSPLELSIRRTGTTMRSCRLGFTFSGQVDDGCGAISIELMCLSTSSFDAMLDLSLVPLPVALSRSAFLSTCFQSNLSCRYGAANSLKVVETRIHRAKAVLSGSWRRCERIDRRTSIGRDGEVFGSLLEGGVGNEV